MTAYVAVTGHMDLTPESVPLVRAAIQEELEPLLRARDGDVYGVSGLAPGADQVFAEVMLDLGGEVIAVLASADYLPPDGARHTSIPAEMFTRVNCYIIGDHLEGSEEAWRDANDTMLRMADSLIAVWDGHSRRLGGTGDMVDRARAAGVPVTVVWPDGAARVSSGDVVS